MNHAGKKFTLVELLVVITIISVLAAMLLPALSKSVAQAKELACKNKLKQIGLSFSLYFDDNKQYFPAPYWDCWECLCPNLGIERDAAGLYQDTAGMLLCPADSNPAPVDDPSSKGSGMNLRVSYGMNFVSFNLNASSAFKITKVKPPFSTFILVADGGGEPKRQLISPFGSALPVAQRHHGGSNVLFADYHVEWRTYDDLTSYRNGIRKYWSWSAP